MLCIHVFFTIPVSLSERRFPEDRPALEYYKHGERSGVRTFTTASPMQTEIGVL